MSLNVQLRGSQFGRVAEVDEVGGYLVVIGVPHHHVHDGVFFTAGHSDVALAASGTLELLIRTGATETVHAELRTSFGGDGQVQLFEGPTVTADGTALSEVNHNRQSATAATVAAFHTPTTTADGTELFSELVPGGSPGKKVGGAAQERQEWVLDASTDYLVRLTNLSATAELVGVTVDWYEEQA